jgi:hypothetical protein
MAQTIIANRQKLDSSGSSVQITEFTANGTYTIPVGAKLIEVELLGGGGGGGSGRKGAAATVRCGGGGGASGGVSKNIFLPSDLTPTITVTVGVAGTGGNAVTTNSTSGNAGIAGGVTSFGVYLKANGGNAGAGGTLTSGNAGNGGTALTYNGGTGGAASTSGGTGNGANSATPYTPSGGGAGGGISNANVANTGGSGNIVAAFSNFIGLPTNLGAVATNGGNGATPLTNGVNVFLGYGGGGGGASITATNAGSGGAGSGRGSGGGGGGAGVDAVNNSGAGGAGQAGLARITAYF